MVPVSWPPWPGSITIRLIFRPSARVSERWPSRVGLDSLGGTSAVALVASAFVFAAVFAAADVAEAGSGLSPAFAATVSLAVGRLATAGVSVSAFAAYTTEGVGIAADGAAATAVVAGCAVVALAVVTGGLLRTSITRR